MRRMLNNLSTDHTALPLPAFIIILFVCVSAREATITTYYNTSLTHSQHRKNKTRNNKYMRDLLLSFFIRSFFAGHEWYKVHELFFSTVVDRRPCDLFLFGGV